MSSKEIDYKELFGDLPFPSFVVRITESGSYELARSNKAATDLFKSSIEDLNDRPLKSLLNAGLMARLQEAIEGLGPDKRMKKIRASGIMVGDVKLGGFVLSKFGEDMVQVIGVPADETSQDLLQERDDAISLLTSVFDVSEVGIVVTDQSQRIVRINDSFVRIYGWSRDELIGKSFVELITQDERERAAKNHEEFMKSGIRSSGEMKIMRKDGNVANALFTTATLELSQGRSFQVTTIMDITLRKQMELSLRLAKEQADTANQAKSTFLANMSHELRTPLNAIIGFSEMMMKETFGALANDKYKEYLADIHLSARHLLEIINEVLDMSKIEAGRVELDEENINIRDLIISVTRMMASRAFSSGLKLEENIEEDLPTLFADPRLVRQILINLVGNAVKYSKSEGVIEVNAHQDDKGHLALVVKDTGIGIPEDSIKQALEPFGQVSMSKHSSPVQGTGLGLPLAKAMTELHQGRLELESKLGEGTKVSVFFPPARLRTPTRGGKASPLSKFGKKSAEAGLAQKAE